VCVSVYLCVSLFACLHVCVHRDDYFRMKLQWKSIDEDQESRFSDLRDRRSLIGLSLHIITLSARLCLSICLYLSVCRKANRGVMLL